MAQPRTAGPNLNHMYEEICAGESMLDIPTAEALLRLVVADFPGAVLKQAGQSRRVAIRLNDIKDPECLDKMGQLVRARRRALEAGNV